MRAIQLSKGQVALVEDADFSVVAPFKWSAKPISRAGGGYYAFRTQGGTTIYMHRVLLNAGAGQIVDHVDGDGLNNCRANLRLTNASGNMVNRRASSACGFRGVSRDPRSGRWRAYVYRPLGPRQYLGFFDTAEQAAAAYDKGALRIHGEMARLNFPEATQ